MRLWFLQSEDYFKRNTNQCRSEQDRIKYALKRVNGEDVVVFASTYRNKMTGELAHLKIEVMNFERHSEGSASYDFLSHMREKHS